MVVADTFSFLFFLSSVGGWLDGQIEWRTVRRIYSFILEPDYKMGPCRSTKSRAPNQPFLERLNFEYFEEATKY